MRTLRQKAAFALLPVAARAVIRLLRATMRIEYAGYEKYRELAAGGQRVILAFWHGRLLMMPYCYLGKGASILVSQSKDGELISRTIEGFGIGSVRGSTTRGWVAGLKGMLQAARAGKDLAITPDGPKGPGMAAQMGAVQIAKATGLPILPVTFGASKKKFSAAGILL